MTDRRTHDRTSQIPRRPRVATKVVLATLVSLVSLVVAILGASLIGPYHLDLAGALSGSDPIARRILFAARLPRAIMAGLTGVVLAASGVVLQGLLRNPLAEPYTLGVSSGASAGAVLAILTGANVTVFGMSSVPLFALAGALIAIGVVYLLAKSLSRASRGIDSTTLLLAGICLALTFHALILLAHYIADFGNSYRMLRWLMGGLGVTGYRSLFQILPFAATGLAFQFVITADLNVLAGGEDLARTRGVDVAWTQKIAYFGASLATAAVVAVVGPIGFVGLIVPHVVRSITGPDHRILLPAASGAGGVFLIACDTLARTVFAPAELPVGVLTALIGGPFTIILLMRHRELKH
ncbi:MAG: iron ABC transporter permease [Deltaproteobacteria bacterium]|nr:iron ABC transporter permease [Deltaproteobacteria bacterium]